MVIRDVHWLSRILLMCPAHLQFHLLICSITSMIVVLSLTKAFVFLSRCVISFHLFGAVYSLLPGCCVSVCFRCV